MYTPNQHSSRYFDADVFLSKRTFRSMLLKIQFFFNCILLNSLTYVTGNSPEYTAPSFLLHPTVLTLKSSPYNGSTFSLPMPDSDSIMDPTILF